MQNKASTRKSFDLDNNTALSLELPLALWPKVLAMQCKVENGLEEDTEASWVYYLLRKGSFLHQRSELRCLDMKGVDNSVTKKQFNSFCSISSRGTSKQLRQV
jgi:hypothetical protein